MLEKHSESEVHVDKLEQGPASSISFGLERIGLIAVRAPLISCIVLLALIVLHLAAVAFHHFVKRDRVAARMMGAGEVDHAQEAARAATPRTSG